MSKLGSNIVVLLNTETGRRINWRTKFRRLNQCEIPIHCYDFVFISVYSVFSWIYLLLQKLSYKSYLPLFTIIMNDLILYQNFLKGEKGCYLMIDYPLFSEAAHQRCSYKKMFWKNAAHLQKNTHAEVRFQ